MMVVVSGAISGDGEVMNTTPPWLLVTPKQLQQGWIELRWIELKGVVPIHHEFTVLRQRDDGTYIVRNPELQLLLERVDP